MTVTSAQLRTLVRSVVKKAKEKGAQTPRFVGVGTEDRVLDHEPIDVDGRTWHVLPVRSSLQARRALIEAGDSGSAVLVTSLGESELGLEVIARFATRRLESIQPWQAVRELFDAIHLDPRIVRQSWMAAALLENAPPDGYKPARGGFLDLETAWGVLMPRLGLPHANPTVDHLLGASASGRLAAAWGAADDALRAGAIERIREFAGPSGKAMVKVIEEGHGDKLVPIGLLVRLLGTPELSTSTKATEVRVRLETMGLREIELTGIEPWGLRAAGWCLDQAKEDLDALHSILSAAQSIADEVGATEIIEWSDELPGGLDARITRFAASVRHFVDQPTDARRLAEVEAARERMASHLLASVDPIRRTTIHRSEMAVRLARRLRRVEIGEPVSLADHATFYRDEAAWADRARFEIVSGEGDAVLGDAYQRLASLAWQSRELQNVLFAESMRRVCAGTEGSGTVLPIERVMAEVVVPLASAHGVKVMIVVMDGLSHPIFQQLTEDLDRRDKLVRSTRRTFEAWPPVITLLPSLTEVCRTSLLSGRVSMRGDDEAEGFAELAEREGWRGQKKSGHLLFRKADLTGTGGGLSSAARGAIGSTAKVVAAVVNAVDDQLGSGDQLRPEWSLKTVPLLEELVEAAELERRAIVLVADHGHVVDLGHSEKIAAEAESGRWRKATRPPGEGEIEIRGERVMLPEPGGPIIVPCGGRVRYSSKHAGYHGGVTAQEVVAPLAVYLPGNVEVEGWAPEVVEVPAWWSRRIDGPVPEPKPRTIHVPDVKVPKTLFEPRPEVTAPEVPGWVGRLLASEIYAGQRALAGRRPPANDDVSRVLVALDEAGGTETFGGLRNQLRIPEARLTGLLSAISRILNIDGYGVLEMDHGSRSASLHRELLNVQFHLEQEAES